MNEKILILLLQLWHLQLTDALNTAKSMLPDPEPVRERRWRAPVLFHPIIRPPTEDDPPNQWEWVDVSRTAPPLVALEETIQHIGAQIDYLEAGQAE